MSALEQDPPPEVSVTDATHGAEGVEHQETAAGLAAAAGAAAGRALRKQFDAEAKAAVAAAMAGGAEKPPLHDDKPTDRAGDEQDTTTEEPDTWADVVRAAVRDAVRTSLLDAVAPPAPGDGGEDAEEVVEEDEPEPPLCPDVQTWVEHVYAPTYVRKITQTQRWCPSWWAHPEAIVRLTALWRTWEAARASEDDTAMADWVRAYLDAINPVLLAADAGPFASCAPDRHSEQAPMPLTAPPADYWAED